MNALKATLPIAALFLSSHAEARCTVPRIRTLSNQTVQGTMYADSGQRCIITMRSSSGPTEGARIVATAAHGTSSVSGQTVFYISKAGYTGEDHFTYARFGLDKLGHPRTRTVEVTVVVSANNSPFTSGNPR